MILLLANAVLRAVYEFLTAAGNCSGNFFFGDYPITISGTSHGRACTGGRRRGQFAADRALGA